MDALDATEPDELPTVLDKDEDPVARADDRRLESLLERALRSDAEPDEALLPTGSEAPFGATDADGMGAWSEHEGDPIAEHGPFGDAGTAQHVIADDDSAPTDEWPEHAPAVEPPQVDDGHGLDSPSAEDGDDDLDEE